MTVPFKRVGSEGSPASSTFPNRTAIPRNAPGLHHGQDPVQLNEFSAIARSPTRAAAAAAEYFQPRASARGDHRPTVIGPRQGSNTPGYDPATKVT